MPGPPPVDVTESIESLIEYDRQKRRYEERLESINAKLEERNAAFQAKASIVRLLLPEGHILRHGYQGDRPELQGKFYAISHKPAQRRNQLPRITAKPTKRPHTPSL